MKVLTPQRVKVYCIAVSITLGICSTSVATSDVGVAISATSIAISLLRKNSDTSASLMLENLNLSKEILAQVNVLNDAIQQLMLQAKEDKKAIITAVARSNLDKYILDINSIHEAIAKYTKNVELGKKDRLSGKKNVPRATPRATKDLEDASALLAKSINALVSLKSADPLVTSAIVGAMRLDIDMLRELGGDQRDEITALDQYKRYFEDKLLNENYKGSFVQQRAELQLNKQKSTARLQNTHTHGLLSAHKLSEEDNSDVPFYCYYVFDSFVVNSASFNRGIAYFYKWVTVDRTPRKLSFDGEERNIAFDSITESRIEGPYWSVAKNSPPPDDGTNGYPIFKRINKGFMQELIERPPLTHSCIPSDMRTVGQIKMHVMPQDNSNLTRVLSAPLSVMTAQIDADIAHLDQIYFRKNSSYYRRLKELEDTRLALEASHAYQQAWTSTWDDKNPKVWIGLPALENIERDLIAWKDEVKVSNSLSLDIEAIDQAIELTEAALRLTSKYLATACASEPQRCLDSGM